MNTLHQADFTQLFYYLQSDKAEGKPFWFLQPDPVSRNIIKTTLLDTYFPVTKNNFIQSKEKGEGYIHDLEEYLPNEPDAKYKSIKIETEEDVSVHPQLI